MSGNKEVITGSDFKRMVMGAYSEFLLEYESINALKGGGTLPGTHILRTMGAAVQPLADTKDDGIGGLSRRVAAAAIFGARGSSGVVLAQLFRGIGKGLLGKYNATSSEFGKAFQYGILYAQRVLPDSPERPIITVAKAVAKEAVDGTTNVVQIVRGEVHKVFGPDVTLAPAKKLADGSTAVPWSKLSPEEQSKINAQLVQEQLKAATLLTANLGKEVAKEPEDDDPWNTPIPQTPIAEGNANDVQPPEHHVKHVDVPDVSDDVDPWATPLPTPQTDGQEQGQPNGPEQPRQNQPEQHSERHSARQSAREMQSQQAQQPASSPAGFADDPWGAPMPVQAGPPEPEVAPEDDEYSMSDESIGASNALDMNDLNRVFEVKKVEEFSSDDPHNPRNMQVKKTLDD